MPEESVVLEDTVEETEDFNIEDFDWHNYAQYFPEAVREKLETVFETKRYGWKKTARLLRRIEKWDSYLKELYNELADRADSKLGKPRGPHVIHPRDGLRAGLMALREDALQKLCDEFTVSYNSFMATGDKAGLVEAIMDEMIE